MRALQLDYQRSTRPLPWLGLVVLAAALTALALLASHYYELGQRIDQWEERVAHDARQAGHRVRALQPISAQAARDQALEVQHANQVLRQLSLPWDTLFRAVESAGGENVALLSLEPDLQKGSVRISGEAKNFDAMLEYIRQLTTRDVFGSVHLQNHQIRQDDPQKPVRFSLLAVWKVGAP